MAEVAVGELFDEPRRESAGRVAVADDPAARERVQSFLLTAGAVRPDPETVWAVGRRHGDAGYLAVELAGGDRDDPATVCVLPPAGLVFVDSGGPLLDNDVVAAVRAGYFERHDGAFRLHAEPLPDDDSVADARAALEAAGLVEDGEGRGPFADGLTTVARELDERVDGPD